MKRPVEDYKEPLDPKKVLQSLVLVKTALRRMPLDGKAYGPLAGLIRELDWDEKLPTATAIQKQLRIDAKVYRRWLEALHADFLALIEVDADALHFTDVEHHFYVEGWRERVGFWCRVSVTPRIGERVELPFLEEMTGETGFYVASVTHEYLPGKTIISLLLRPGRFNSYLHHLGQRARYEGKFPREAWGMSDAELTEFYRKLYP